MSDPAHTLTLHQQSHHHSAPQSAADTLARLSFDGDGAGAAASAGGDPGPTSPAAATPRPTDPALFEREMSPHIDALYRNALRLTGNSNDADDLVQDTYLRAFRFFYQYQPGTNAKAWLFRIMNTVFLNEYRRRSRQADTVSYDGLEDFYLYNRLADEGTPSPQQQAAANPEDVVLNRLDREAIQAAISRLPNEFRDTVALATLEGLAYQEISDILQIPIGTVRSRLSRGRRLLQKALWNQLSALPEEEGESASLAPGDHGAASDDHDSDSAG